MWNKVLWVSEPLLFHSTVFRGDFSLFIIFAVFSGHSIICGCSANAHTLTHTHGTKMVEKRERKSRQYNKTQLIFECFVHIWIWVCVLFFSFCSPSVHGIYQNRWLCAVCGNVIVSVQLFFSSVQLVARSYTVFVCNSFDDLVAQALMEITTMYSGTQFCFQ